MFFIASKILGFVSTPSNLIALLGAAGVLLLVTPWRGAGVKAMAVCIVLLLLLGFSPLGNFLMLSLSERFPAMA